MPQKRSLAPLLLVAFAACSDAPQTTSPVLAFENPQYSLGLAAEATADTLVVGESIQLRSSLPSSRGRTRATSTLWTSQNTSVATVTSSGFVSTKSAGKTLIIASNNLGVESATIHVVSPVVTPPPPPPPPATPPPVTTPPAPTAGTLAVELPRVFLDDMVNEARSATPVRSIAVSTGRELQAAVDTSRYGDEIVLQAGVTYVGNGGGVVLRKKSGNGWITIRSTASLPSAGQRIRPSQGSLARIVSQHPMSPALVTDPGAHNYRLVGVEVTTIAGATMAGALVTLGSADNQATLESQPYNLVLDRVYIHGTPSLDFRRCLALNSGATAVVDSWLGECHSRGFDSQAIWGATGTGPYKIVNNMLEGAGENVMFGGADPAIPNALPSDIEFRRNHVYKPLSWKGVWSVKNSFELKIGRRVLIEGNIFENNWNDAQVGFAIVLKSTNQDGGAPWSQTTDVTFQYNIIRNSTFGLSMAARPEMHPALPASRIRIAHNSFENLSTNARVMQSAGIQGLSIENNAGFGNAFNGFILHDAAHSNFTMINNIFGTSSSFLASADGLGTGTEGLNGHAGPNWVFRRNVIVGARADAYPSDNFYPAHTGLVGFLNTGINFALGGASPYLTAGTDGKPVGPNYAALAAATAGVLVSP